MCMKYVNVNVQCFASPVKGLLRNLDFSSITGEVKSKPIGDKFIVGDFNIVTFINIRGTRDKNNLNNFLNAKKKLNFRIRLTKLAKNKEERFSYDLKDFDIDLANESNIKEACFRYLERIEVTNVENLALKSTGDYVIKILVKCSEDSLYDVQMLHPLIIK